MNKYYPNREKIIEHRKSLKLSKSSITGEFIKYGLTKQKGTKKIGVIGNKTYYSIEEGEVETSEKNLKYLAQLFTKAYQAKGVNKNVSVQDIINQKNKILDRKKISTYLWRTSSADKLLSTLDLMHLDYKKVFYNFKINKNIRDNIKSLLLNIQQLTSLKSKNRTIAEQEQDYNVDFENLDFISFINTNIEELREKGVCVYSGIMKAVPMAWVLHEFDFDFADLGGQNVVVLCEKRDYLILNFASCKNGENIEATYESNITLKELSERLKANPYKKFHKFQPGKYKFEKSEIITHEFLARTHYNMNAEQKRQKKIPFVLDSKSIKFDTDPNEDSIYFENSDEFEDAVRDFIAQEEDDMAASHRSDELRGK